MLITDCVHFIIFLKIKIFYLPFQAQKIYKLTYVFQSHICIDAIRRLVKYSAPILYFIFCSVIDLLWRIIFFNCFHR